MPKLSRGSSKSIIPFIRKKDYTLVERLGNGACGETVLLHDPLVDEHFVCKKYHPYSELERVPLFQRFVDEVKLLHRINHPNVVRVFNYYLYPDVHHGYILMEYVDGTHLPDFARRHPEELEDLFVQAVDGFSYLEESQILHRDIRPANIMVSSGGQLKIIDLGFGKRVETSGDFDKSIKLNQWCDPPSEFAKDRYDFCTEVYFLGMLFQQILLGLNVHDFSHKAVLGRMVRHRPEDRLSSFAEVQRAVRTGEFHQSRFSDAERETYQEFSCALRQFLSKVDTGVSFNTDLRQVRAELQDVYKASMLEADVPDPKRVARALFTGDYYYKKNATIPVSALKGLIELLTRCGEDKGNIILANLQSVVAAKPPPEKKYGGYPGGAPPDDDIPF